MATTINSYSVSLGMDARGYVDGAQLSRRETNMLVRDIESARTPAERFAHDQDRMREALDKGAISIGTYNRLLQAKREQYGMLEESSLAYAKSLAGPLAVGIGVIATATGGAMVAGVEFVKHLKETQDQIDSVADAAGKLGVEYNALVGLRFAAQESGGVEAGQVDVAIKKMQIALSKGSGAFAELGLNSEALKASGAVEAFSQIADKMSQISDHADKLRIATEIFGKGGSELVSTLDSGRDSIVESVEFMTKFGGLTDAQVLAVQKSNDAFDRIGIVVDGISTKLAGEFAAAMLMGNEKALSMAEAWNGIDRTITDVVDNVVYQVGSLKDLMELMLALKGIGTPGAFKFDSGVAALDALYAKRADLEREAARNKVNQQTLELEEETASIEKLQKEINDAASDRIQREEKQRRDMHRRLSENALKAANDVFEKERANALKLRDEIAKGPGGGIMADSNEAAKFMADQVNKALAGDSVTVPGKPTEEMLLEEARKQYEQALADSKKTDEQTELLKKLVEKTQPIGRAR